MFKIINNIAATIIDGLFTHIMIKMLAQNLSLLLEVCVQFITVKILSSITVPLSGIW